MDFVSAIKSISENNIDKKIAMFCDMDGTIVDLEVYKYNEVSKNKPGLFLNKKPLISVIEKLRNISKLDNVDLFILSACSYENQAEDKSKWLEKHADMFKKENQIFVIKEITGYNKETKKRIKVNNIMEVLEDRNYDLAIYLEDEYTMLNEAYTVLGDRVFCFHISNLID